VYFKHQQKFVPVIIRYVHHVKFNLQQTDWGVRSPFVAKSLDRHGGLKVATRVWRCMPTRMLVCCVVSVLAQL
jgi:hypothetical protein